MPIQPQSQRPSPLTEEEDEAQLRSLLDEMGDIIAKRGLAKETVRAIRARTKLELVPPPRKAPQNRTAQPAAKPDQPEPANNQDTKPAAAPKPMPREKKRRMIFIGIIAAEVILIVGLLSWLHFRRFQTTDDAYIDGHVSQVAPQAAGRIQTLLVDDNQRVEQGQLLAEIDPSDYLERLGQAESQFAQASAQEALQQANVSQAEANVAVAEADAFQADQDLKRYRAVDPKAITSQQFDTALASDRSAHAKLEANRQAVEAARAQVAIADADIRQAEVDVSNAKLQLSYCSIVAPISGHITRRTVEVGNVVSVGQPLLAIVSDDLWVTANYKETQLDRMRIGQPVRIKVDAFPGVVFDAHVDSFQRGSGSVFSALPAENATGNFVKVVQRIPVKIVFDDPQQRDRYPLAPGMSVDPRVTVR